MAKVSTSASRLAKVAKAAKQDWLVIISVAGGAGTWARGADRDETLRRCVRMFRRDWKSLFKTKGVTVKANVLEVTGFDKVEWDQSITVDGMPFEGVVEVVTVLL